MGHASLLAPPPCVCLFVQCTPSSSSTDVFCWIRCTHPDVVNRDGSTEEGCRQEASEESGGQKASEEGGGQEGGGQEGGGQEGGGQESGGQEGASWRIELLKELFSLSLV